MQVLLNNLGVRLGLLATVLVASWVTYAATTEASVANAGALRICVSSASAVLPSQAAAAQVDGVVQRLEESHNRFSARLEARGEKARVVPFQRPKVVVNCPDGFQRPLADPDQPMRGAVAHPSDYAIKVFVVADDETGVLRGKPFRVVPYEVTCESEHVCAQATTALYVSAGLVNSPDELFSAVEFATGLASPEHPQSEGPREKKP